MDTLAGKMVVCGVNMLTEGCAVVLGVNPSALKDFGSGSHAMDVFIVSAFCVVINVVVVMLAAVDSNVPAAARITLKPISLLTSLEEVLLWS